MARIRWAARFVEPYFSVRWDDGKTAAQAFGEAKETAINALRKGVADIETMTFDQFARYVCAQDVGPETTRGGSERALDEGGRHD